MPPQTGVGDLGLLQSLEIGVTPQLPVWNLDSLLKFTLVSLRSRESSVTPMSGASDLESLHILESGVWNHSVVWGHSGVWGQQSRVSPQSGVRSLDSLMECTLVSLRIRETGVTPLRGDWDLESLHILEPVVWIHTVVWGHSGVWCHPSGVCPQSGVWSLESGIWSHPTDWSLASGVTPGCGVWITPEYGVWSLTTVSYL